MIPMRQSGATTKNALFVAQPPEPPRPSRTTKAAAAPSRDRNLVWLRQMRKEHGLGEAGDVVLIGGRTILDFRLRIAQSHARHDLTPSYWSTVGIVDTRGRLVTVPLTGWPDAAAVPGTNAIATLPMSTFDDSDRYPNIAILRFPGTTGAVLDRTEDLKLQRSVADLPALVLEWLQFAWATGSGGNPLVHGSGIPSAVLVVLAFGLISIEVTPGLASSSSCPEAIWQSVRWWQDFYTQAVAGRPQGTEPSTETAPWGRYLTRQRLASYLEPLPG